MFSILYSYYYKRFSNLYITDINEKCKKHYNSLYFGGTKYCVKEDKIDEYSMVFF